jgi:hypothetical protein
MGSFLIVETQPNRECRTPMCRGGVRNGVGPLAQQRLDHSLGFAVGMRAIGPGAFHADLEPATGLAERLRAIDPCVAAEAHR